MAVKRVEVAAAVIQKTGGEFLLAQRPAGKVYAGYWEFPGGKVEPGESAADALKRELQEELGIEVATVFPWVTRDFDYEHAFVRLRFFRVFDWRGELQNREQQQFAWQSAGNVDVAPVLPANGPILRALELPDIYGITCASQIGHTEFLSRLGTALERGLRLIQVREKSMPDDARREFAREVVVMAHRYGARVLVNSTSKLAEEVGADGIHMTAAQLMACSRRPTTPWCAASCHNAEELRRARDLGVDFVVLGPVATTPTHPGAPALGWERFAKLIADFPLPVFALGGMSRNDLNAARQHGAHGLAMMRGAWLASN